MRYYVQSSRDSSKKCFFLNRYAIKVYRIYNDDLPISNK